MARRTDIRKIDDLNEASGDDVTTVTFALDGIDYEIDLSADNTRALRATFRRFITAARPTHPRRSTKPTPAIVSTRNRSNTSSARDIRAWAQQAGYYLSPLGPIPLGVREAYERNQPMPAPPILGGLIAVLRDHCQPAA